jgi:peptidoglycan-associated lipoprotein
MIAYGVDPSRIGVVSFGKERSVIVGHTSESWAENRRGVLTIM